MPDKKQMVTPAPQGGWNVKVGGSAKATKHFDTKKEAVEYATYLSKKQGSSLVLKKKDGQFQKGNSYRVKGVKPVKEEKADTKKEAKKTTKKVTK